ncbi:glycosyltransferase family 4 protein [Hymenobacter terricola]|uniref:glycosyltransferase family 4 protein n=1 Tax=Hymenobacter terricola TaxID=2819236 RepID=UPI001B314040|nr:glycosyltransferase family 4 protein [Hymenobacter terricola]
MNVLISAYACNPTSGGESGCGFHWTWETIRQGHRVWCLTHPDGKADIERFMAEHQAELAPGQLQVTYVQVPALVDFLHRWQFGVYLHYFVWQYLAWRHARKLNQQVAFDYVHHATYASLQMGSWMWRLGRPMVFGPVGGAQRAPKAFKAYLPGWFKTETLRDAISWLLMTFDPNVRQNVRRAAVVLVSNSETAVLARRLGGKRVELFLDSGLPESFISPECPVRTPGPTLQLLWLARLFPRKALPLVLDALSRVDVRVPFHLTVIGDGPLGPLVPGWIARYGLEGRVTWRGSVEWSEVQAAMLSHDIFLFGSLRDAFAAQFLEAMATALPVITLDHQGAHDFIPATAGIKVPVTTPHETATALARAVEYCYDHPVARAAMGRAGYEFARTQTWPRRAARLQRRVARLLRPAGRPAKTHSVAAQPAPIT